MKQWVLAVCTIVLVDTASAQRISPQALRQLQKQEDSLKKYAVRILQDTVSLLRLQADSMFTRILVRALKNPYSIQYPFDSLTTISRISPPDSSFRIYTWQLYINESVTRQHGAIQMRTDDGSLKLFPLIDKSDITRGYSDTIGDNKGWMGAVYYKIIPKKSGTATYYTLLGYDENNSLSTKKVIELLYFSNDLPVFGNRLFSFEEDSVFKTSRSRYVLEFKKGAGARLTYDAEMDMIVVEHLISETGEPKKKWTLIPDGDYEGFKWKNGKWIHVEKIFNYVTPEGKEPVPSPIRADDGTIDDSKLPTNGYGDEPPTEAPKPAAAKPKPPKKPKRGRG